MIEAQQRSIDELLLLLDTPDRSALKKALEPTWSHPEQFEQELAAWMSQHGSFRSSLGKRVDLFGDLVSRHLDCPTPALLFEAPVQEQEPYREASFRELSEETARLATRWHRAGVKSGSRVAVTGRCDPVGLLPLLTSLRLGATAVVVAAPDARPPLLEARVKAADPDFVAVPDLEAGSTTLPIRSHPGDLASLSSDASYYGPEDPALEFWGAGFHPGRPVVCSAGQLLLGLVIDSLFSVRLQTGWRVAAPELAASRVLPGLCLLTLFSGACWVETSLPKLLEHPLTLQMVGVHPKTRAAILDRSLSARGWKRWFRDPSEPLDWSDSHTLVDRLQHLPSQNLLFSSTLGGCILFSPPSKELSLDVLPSPGRPYVLEEPASPGQITESSTGILAGRDGILAQAATGRILLAETDTAYMYAGSMLPGRFANAYPSDEVESLLREHPVVEQAVVLVEPMPGILNGARVYLLIFVDPARDPATVSDLLSEHIVDLIQKNYGPSARPDRVLSFSLFPRLTPDGIIDRAWCSFQLSTGGLRAKSHNQAFRLCSMLRRWAHAQG